MMLINQFREITHKIKKNTKAFVIACIVTFIITFMIMITTTVINTINSDWVKMGSKYNIKKEYYAIQILTNIRKRLVENGASDNGIISNYLKDKLYDCYKLIENKIPSNDLLLDIIALRTNYPKQITIQTGENSNDLNKVIIKNFSSYFVKPSSIEEVDKIVRYHAILSIIGYYTENKIIHNDPDYQNILEPLIENSVNNIQSIPSIEGKITMYYTYIQVLWAKDWGYTYRAMQNNLNESLKKNEIGLFLKNNELFCQVNYKNALPIKIYNGQNNGISQTSYNQIIEKLKKVYDGEDLDLSYDNRKELLNYASSQGYTHSFQDNVCRDINYLKAKAVIGNAKLLVDARLQYQTKNKYSYDKNMSVAIYEYANKIQNFSRKRCSEELLFY